MPRCFLPNQWTDAIVSGGKTVGGADCNREAYSFSWQPVPTANNTTANSTRKAGLRDMARQRVRKTTAVESEVRFPHVLGTSPVRYPPSMQSISPGWVVEAL